MLTVKKCLAERHNSGSKANQCSQGTIFSHQLFPLPHNAANTLPLGEVQAHIDHVEERLQQIQRRLRGREPIARLESPQSIHVVNLSVERVGGPYRSMPFASNHGVRTTENVARVPENEREGDGHPEKREGRGGVRPGART